MYAGMNFTVNCVLHALSKIDITAPKFRLQVDGASDNISYAVFAMCGILLLAGIFEEIIIARLPVGLDEFVCFNSLSDSAVVTLTAQWIQSFRLSPP